MMKDSIRMSGRRFSAERMIEDYYNLMYQPQASDLAAAAMEQGD